MEDLPAVKPEPLAWDARTGITEASHDVGDAEQMGDMNDAGVPGPVLNIIQPMPQNSPIKPPTHSNTNTFLNVPPPDTWATSETLSVASSVSETTTEKIHHYASQGVWKSCQKMVVELQSYAILSINVQMLFEVTMIVTYIQHKEMPPCTINIQDHWQYITHAAEELVSGKNQQDIE